MSGEDQSASLSEEKGAEEELLRRQHVLAYGQVRRPNGRGVCGPTTFYLFFRVSSCSSSPKFNQNPINYTLLPVPHNATTKDTRVQRENVNASHIHIDKQNHRLDVCQIQKTTA